MLAQAEHRGPDLFAAEALVTGMLQEGLICTVALIRHPRVMPTYPSQSESIGVNRLLAQVPPSVIPEHYASIRVVPTTSQQSESIQAIRVYSTTAPAIRLSPSQFIIITYYYIL